MFNMDRRYNRRSNRPIVASFQIKHVHSRVSYTNVRSIKNTIGMVKVTPNGYGAVVTSRGENEIKHIHCG